MQIVEYFLLELSLIFRYKLGMSKGSWVYVDSVLCGDWERRINSYDSVLVLQKLDSYVDLSTSQGVCLVSRLLLFWLQGDVIFKFFYRNWIERSKTLGSHSQENKIRYLIGFVFMISFWICFIKRLFGKNTYKPICIHLPLCKDGNPNIGKRKNLNMMVNEWVLVFCCYCCGWGGGCVCI
jgi:hypothetical protein